MATDYKQLSEEYESDNARLYKERVALDKENEELQIERDTLEDEHIANVNRIEELEGDNEELQARLDSRIEDLETASDRYRELNKRIELASDAEHNRQELLGAAIVLGLSTGHSGLVFGESHSGPFKIHVAERCCHIQNELEGLRGEVKVYERLHPKRDYVQDAES